MRVAVLNDVHGNLPALEAVLAEVATLDVDEIVVGGDVVAGPFPRESSRQAASISARSSCAGTPTASRRAPRRASGTGSPSASIRSRSSSCASARTPLSLGGVLYCHGSPRDDDEILTRVSPDERFRAALAGVEERLVVGGHTHVQFVREIDGIRFANAGQRGHALRGPARRVLGASSTATQIEHRHTPYAVDAAVVAIRAIGYPEADEFCKLLLEPEDPDEVSAYFESVAT